MTEKQWHKFRAEQTVYFHSDVSGMARKGIQSGLFHKINRRKTVKTESIVVVYVNTAPPPGWKFIRLSRAFLTRQDAVISAENEIRDMERLVYFEKYEEAENAISEIVESARGKIYLSARERLEAHGRIERDLNT